MGRLVHTDLGSSSLVAHVLQYPPLPHANSFVLGPAVINTYTPRSSGRTDNAHFFTNHYNGTVVVVIRSGMAGKRTLLVAFKHRRRFLMLSAVGEPRLRVPRHAAGGKAVPQMTLVEAGERIETEREREKFIDNQIDD